jgi:hypothetical protein
MITKEYLFMVLNKGDYIELSLGVEQVVSDIKWAIGAHPEDDGIKQMMHSVHSLYTDMLIRLASNVCHISSTDSIAETDIFQTIIKNSKDRFKCWTGAEISHVDDAYTYNIDYPVDYGLTTKDEYKSLIEYQKEVLNTPLKDLMQVGSPAAEKSILEELEKIDYESAVNDKGCINTKDKVIAFYETEQEDFSDDY